jgi:hypothetical protein
MIGYAVNLFHVRKNYTCIYSKQIVIDTFSSHFTLVYHNLQWDFWSLANTYFESWSRNAYCSMQTGNKSYIFLKDHSRKHSSRCNNYQMLLTLPSLKFFKLQFCNLFPSICTCTETWSVPSWKSFDTRIFRFTNHNCSDEVRCLRVARNGSEGRGLSVPEVYNIPKWTVFIIVFSCFLLFAAKILFSRPSSQIYLVLIYKL